MRKLVLAVASVVSTVSFAACGFPQEGAGAKRETAATEQLLDAASTAVGVPAIQNFTEKRQLKMLYELRDQANLVTYSYYVDLSGKRHKICPTTSVGFGMPFSAQFTAPQRPSGHWSGNHYYNGQTFQPEPNGLYMPDNTTATWVICLGSDGKTLKPVYVEPQIIVSLESMD